MPPIPPANAPAQIVAFRYASYDVPFWVRPNTRPGRWNLPGEAPTQYWSLTPDGAWAELIRAEDLGSEQELDLVRMSIWACRVPCAMLVDLTREDARDAHGIGEPDLVGEDRRACQALATRLRATSAKGLLSPSAALPGDVGLTLFGPRRAIDWRREPALASAVPTARVALGRPPEGLLERVRRSAAAHGRSR
ncbi:MAG: RES family NAD+ phosphorylase [Solirubrobacteraceae bacterium]|nr:RES family NAD+ phosphorylase [Solirubrobacteraceae bacterium]